MVQYDRKSTKYPVQIQNGVSSSVTNYDLNFYSLGLEVNCLVFIVKKNFLSVCTKLGETPSIRPLQLQVPLTIEMLTIPSVHNSGWYFSKLHRILVPKLLFSKRKIVKKRHSTSQSRWFFFTFLWTYSFKHTSWRVYYFLCHKII